MPRSTRPLAGHPVMITGAASGIGRGLARLLSRRGSPVAIADIDEAGLKQRALGDEVVDARERVPSVDRVGQLGVRRNQLGAQRSGGGRLTRARSSTAVRRRAGYGAARHVRPECG